MQALMDSQTQANVYELLDRCSGIDIELNLVDENLHRLQALYQRCLNGPETPLQSKINEDLNILSSDILTSYDTLTKKIKAIKQDPSSKLSRNASQVDKVDRRLEAILKKYREIENTFEKKRREQLIRQHRMVDPQASNADIIGMIEGSPDKQIFEQTVLMSTRQGQSNQVFNAVNDRHGAIRQIETQIQGIAQLSQDIERLVTDQEASVVKNESAAEDTGDRIEKAVDEIDGAIIKSRDRKWKKWYCLLLAVIISIIAVVIIVVVIMTQVVNRRPLGISS